MVCYDIFKDTTNHYNIKIITCTIYVIYVMSNLSLLYLALRGMPVLIVQKLKLRLSVFSDWVSSVSPNCILDASDEHMSPSGITPTHWNFKSKIVLSPIHFHCFVLWIIDVLVYCLWWHMSVAVHNTKDYCQVLNLIHCYITVLLVVYCHTANGKRYSV